MAKPSKESKYETREVVPTVAERLVDGAIETMTLGFVKAGTEIDVTKKETGETHRGWGDDRASARNDAHSKFSKK